MAQKYLPPSPLLRAIIAEEAPSGTDDPATLLKLISLTRDSEPANRDWATLLLSQEGGDTPMVRAALLNAAHDEDAIVRAEAVLGLASRDPALALPFVQEALRADSVALPILEAAALCADPSLIADLRIWTEPSDQPDLDRLAAEALTACEWASREQPPPAG